MCRRPERHRTSGSSDRGSRPKRDRLRSTRCAPDQELCAAPVQYERRIVSSSGSPARTFTRIVPSSATAAVASIPRLVLRSADLAARRGGTTVSSQPAPRMSADVDGPTTSTSSTVTSGATRSITSAMPGVRATDDSSASGSNSRDRRRFGPWRTTVCHNNTRTDGRARRRGALPRPVQTRACRKRRCCWAAMPAHRRAHTTRRRSRGRPVRSRFEHRIEVTFGHLDRRWVLAVVRRPWIFPAAGAAAGPAAQPSPSGTATNASAGACRRRSRLRPARRVPRPRGPHLYRRPLGGSVVVAERDRRAVGLAPVPVAIQCTGTGGEQGVGRLGPVVVGDLLGPQPKRQTMPGVQKPLASTLRRHHPTRPDIGVEPFHGQTSRPRTRRTGVHDTRGWPSTRTVQHHTGPAESNRP